MTTNGSLGTAAEAEKAKTQNLVREVNERINEVSAQRASFDMPKDVICECAQHECSERITITAVEYAGLRSRSTWFVIAPWTNISSPRSNASSRTTATGGSSKSTGTPAWSPRSSIRAADRFEAENGAGRQPELGWNLRHFGDVLLTCPGSWSLAPTGFSPRWR